MHDEYASLVEKVEKEHAAKVAKFWELVRDPELAAHVAIVRNGHQQTGVVTVSAAPFVPPVGFKNGNGIRDAIRALALPARFTCDDVVTALKQENFEFSSSDPRKTVRDSLYVLSQSESPEFRRVRGGVGGQVGVYERIQKVSS
jgi:hypothetical protein